MSSASPAKSREVISTLSLSMLNLSLAVWLGFLLSLALWPALLFPAARSMGVTLNDPTYTSPDLIAEHPDILAGEVVGGAVAVITLIQLIAAGLVFLFALIRLISIPSSQTIGKPITAIGFVLLIALTSIAGYQYVHANPIMFEARDQLYNVNTAAEDKPAIQATFDHYHEQSTQLGKTSVLGVATMLLLLPFTTRPHQPDQLPSSNDDE